MSGSMARDTDALVLVSKMTVPVTRITADSRDVHSGDAFAAYPGMRLDAGVILWEPTGFIWNRDWTIPHLPIEDLKGRLGEIASVVYGHPSREMWMVGVTGTNGKTSCAHWIAAGLESAGRRTAVLGTLGNGLLSALQPASNTTPDAARLHEMLRMFRTAGADAAVMEASSHGIDQGRVNGTAFDIALFTNLSHDHLDYHGTMAAYGAAKAKLFAVPELQVAVINTDDPFGQRLVDVGRSSGQKVLTYGFGAADVVGSRLTTSPAGLAFTVETPYFPALLWRSTTR